jgi:hypothetical protein
MYSGECKSRSAFDGPDIDSTGQRVTEWTIREATDVIRAKQVNANDSVYALAA